MTWAGRDDDARGPPALEAALLGQFAMLSTVFDSLDVVVYVADLATWELLFVNARTERIFGPGWRGRRCYEYLQAEQAGPCSFCTNDRLTRGGVPEPPYAWEFQNTVDRRWYLCIDRAIPWVDGRLVRLEVAVDITERKEIERFREQYVGLVSHDLRNALATISLSAGMLGRVLPAEGPAGASLARLLGGTRRMEAMLADLLESMRLESAAIALQRDPLDLGELARRLLSLLPPETQARIELRAPPRGPELLGDAGRIERAIENLVSNALKYSDAPVVVEIVDEGERARVSVTDRGAGIPADHLRQVFERFYRLPGTGAEGLGLGLYITRMIVERHGGEIDAESAPGRGSRFTFTLPTSA